MRLNLEISYGKDKLNINVSVGNGNVSVKWLALMASHRFATQEKSTCFVGSNVKNFRPLPKNVYTDKSSFLSPIRPVNEVLVDGEKVNVELYNELPLDEYARPIYHPWYIIAFHNSEEHSDLSAKLLQEKEQEAKDIDHHRLREEEEHRIASNLPKLKTMREMMREQLSDQTMIETAMQNEWNLIINNGILDVTVPNREEQEAIRKFLLANYAELSHMFKYYSAVNSQGGTHTLEFIEFSKLVHETKILSGENANIILKFFGADPKTTNIHSEIHKWEFFVSFVKIATYKYVTLAKKPSMTRKKKEHDTTVSKASSPTPSQAVEMMYDEHFKPRIDQLPASAAIKASLGSEEGLLLLHHHLVSLRKTFCTYSETPFDEDTMDENIQNGAMTVKQFSAFATFFLGIAMNENGVTMKDVRQIFSASQSDEASNEEETQLKDENIDSHQELMVFSEFIEAVARLGVLKHSSSNANNDESHMDCIKMALERIKEHE